VGINVGLTLRYFAAGICLVFAGQPFDLIKVRLQTMPIVAGQAPLYTGAVDCAMQTIRKEGVRCYCFR